MIRLAVKCLFFLGLFVSPFFDIAAYDFEGSSGLRTSGGSMGYNVVSPDDPIAITGNIIAIVLSLLGVVFLILTIYGGFLRMTAAGDESKVDSAKSIIKNSIIGLVIVVSAYAISYFVINSLGSSTLSS